MNADDFGASTGINRGIVEAHTDGILTSASLMVTGAGAAEAVALAVEHPELGVGLHWDLDSNWLDRSLDLSDARALRAELVRQLAAFEALVGAPPTHVDSHHHIHRRREVAPIARELADSLGVPLRGHGPVAYVGRFYGQSESRGSDPSRVSPESLISILRHEVGEGWTEIGCHPGYVTDDLTSSYLSEREVELETLKHAGVREEIGALGIRLTSYRAL